MKCGQITTSLANVSVTHPGLTTTFNGTTEGRKERPKGPKKAPTEPKSADLWSCVLENLELRTFIFLDSLIHPEIPWKKYNKF